MLEEKIFLEYSKDKLSKMYDAMVSNIKKEEFIRAYSYLKNTGNKQYFFLSKIQENKIFVDKKISEKQFIKAKFNDTRTGRLSCESTPNLYTMKNSERKLVIAPQGKVLVKLDFIACQLRLFFYLIGKEEYFLSEDPYQLVASNLNCSRETAKIICIKKIFGAGNQSMLRSIDAEQLKKVNEIFDKEINIDYSKDRKFMFDSFDRPIKVLTNKKKTQENNLLQCLERNVLLNACVNIRNFLIEDKINGKIIFPFHDAVCIIMNEGELSKKQQIKYLFENSFTKCKMHSKLKEGKNFLEVS